MWAFGITWHPSFVVCSDFPTHDNGKSYLSFNSLMARVISLLAVYYNGVGFFFNEPIRNKNCLWRPCLLTDRDEMSKIIHILIFFLAKDNVGFWHHLASVVCCLQ
jgi:hypothetical protein